MVNCTMYPKVSVIKKRSGECQGEVGILLHVQKYNMLKKVENSVPPTSHPTTTYSVPQFLLYYYMLQMLIFLHKGNC